MLYLVAVLFLLPINLYLISKFKKSGTKEPWREVLTRFGAANFLTGYIVFRTWKYVLAYLKYSDYFTVLSWVNFFLVMATFVIFLVSYLLRKTAMVYANRLREIILPILCAVLPLVVFELGDPARFKFLMNQSWLKSWLDLYWGAGPWEWNTGSIWLILIGNTLAVAGLFYLRGSFSVFTEVRDLVLEGPYRFIRHPIYVGQSLATIGFCLHSPSSLKIVLTIIFLVAQRFRAHIEEAKLAEYKPEYTSYQKKTGCYFPKFSS